MRLSTGSAPAASRTPRAWAIVGATSDGSRMPDRSTNQAPCRNSLSHRDATSMASRLLPMPPGPVSVSSRVSPVIMRHTVSASASRPTSRCHGAGIRERPLGRTGSGATCSARIGAISPVNASISTMATSSAASVAALHVADAAVGGEVVGLDAAEQQREVGVARTVPRRHVDQAGSRPRGEVVGFEPRDADDRVDVAVAVAVDADEDVGVVHVAAGTFALGDVEVLQARGPRARQRPLSAARRRRCSGGRGPRRPS